MVSSNTDIREFDNALVTIRGNAMRCNNSVFSIRNIVSLTFDSIRKDKPEPYSIEENYARAKFMFKYCLFAFIVVAIFVGLGIDDENNIFTIIEWLRDNFNLYEEDIKEYAALFALTVPLSLAASILFFIIATFTKWNHVNYYYIHGLRVIFVNNMVLYFVANSDTGFIKETIDGIEEFIANPEYRERNEMVINFSNRSVNINEVKNSNVIGGDVQGDISNG